MLYWDKHLKKMVFLNYKDSKRAQIQRFGGSDFPVFESMSRDEFGTWMGEYQKMMERNRHLIIFAVVLL